MISPNAGGNHPKRIAAHDTRAEGMAYFYILEEEEKRR